MAQNPALEIRYCHECGYLPDAVNMTDKLLREFSHKLDSIKLVPGDNGAFEVSIDGKSVFSKLEMGRFPNLKELRDAVRLSVETPRPEATIKKALTAKDDPVLARIWDNDDDAIYDEL